MMDITTKKKLYEVLARVRFQYSRFWKTFQKFFGWSQDVGLRRIH